MLSRPQVNLYADDVALLVAAGGVPLTEPKDWLGRLRVAWLADPEGNPVEIVQPSA